MPPLRLLHQLDDENVPVEHNIFDSTPAHEIIEELGHKANSYVAQKLAKALPEKAFLRRQGPPNPRRLQTFADRMTRIGYEIDTTSSGALQNSLFNVTDTEIRKVSEFLGRMIQPNYETGYGNITRQSYATGQIFCCRANT